jgi:hypothetical protein
MIIFDGASTDGVGVGQLVNDFKIIHLQVCTASSAALTFKVQGSFKEPKLGSPQFSSAASPTNPWDYIAFYDYRNPTQVILGNVGVTLSGTDIVRNYLINVEGMSWLNVEISNYTAGAFSATAISYNNQ